VKSSVRRRLGVVLPAGRSRSCSAWPTWAAAASGRWAAARPTRRWSSTGTGRPGRSSRRRCPPCRPATRPPAPRW